MTELQVTERECLPGDNLWLYDGPPGEGEFLLFGFHYAGTGAAATYGGWPRRIGAGLLCPIQPPGRDNRIDEQPARTHRDFAERLVPGLLGHLDRPYGFVGHCGAFPYMLETALLLRQLGTLEPHRMFASAWGAPHRGPYGRLNTVEFAKIDPLTEVQEASRRRFGFELDPDMAEIAAESLAVDLRIQRTHRYDGKPRVPGQTVVISWTDDIVVPAALITDTGWAECADVTHHLLVGDHWEFMRCPRPLIDLIDAEMAAADRK